MRYLLVIGAFSRTLFLLTESERLVAGVAVASLFYLTAMARRELHAFGLEQVRCGEMFDQQELEMQPLTAHCSLQ